MTQTPNYDLNLFDSNDDMEENSRLGLNDNADKIDTALKDIQDEVDGLSSPAAADVTYDNTVSGLTATDVQDAIDEVQGAIDELSTWSSVDVNLEATNTGTTWYTTTVNEIKGAKECVVIEEDRQYYFINTGINTTYASMGIFSLSFSSGAYTEMVNVEVNFTSGLVGIRQLYRGAQARVCAISKVFYR